MKGDIVESVDGMSAALDSIPALFARLPGMKIGTTVTVRVKRGDKEIDVSSLMLPRNVRHTLTANSSPSREQQSLREAWMKNF